MPKSSMPNIVVIIIIKRYVRAESFITISIVIVKFYLVFLSPDNISPRVIRKRAANLFIPPIVYSNTIFI